jgi:hypothetical protein
MKDTDLTTLVRDAVRDTHMTVPESDIVGRARTLRTRRRVAFGGAAGAGVAAAAFAVTALAIPAASPVSHPATLQTAAWTVAEQPSGVIDVTVRELKDPAGLQARLRADGVPASVRFSGFNPACQDYNYNPPLGKPVADGQRPPWMDDGLFTMTPGAAGPGLEINPSRLRSGEGIQIFVQFGASGNAFTLGGGPVKTSPACTG